MSVLEAVPTKCRQPCLNMEGGQVKGDKEHHLCHTYRTLWIPGDAVWAALHIQKLHGRGVPGVSPLVCHHVHKLYPDLLLKLGTDHHHHITLILEKTEREPAGWKMWVLPAIHTLPHIYQQSSGNSNGPGEDASCSVLSTTQPTTKTSNVF